MIKFSVGVDDLGLGLEAVVATGTAHAIHVHNAETDFLKSSIKIISNLKFIGKTSWLIPSNSMVKQIFKGYIFFFI